MKFPIFSAISLAIFAADPTLDAPPEAKVFVPVTVKLKDAHATTKVKWKIVPEPAWSEKLPDGVGFRFTGPPAKYAIRVDYVDFKKELWGEAATEVVIVGEGPKPPDPVNPVDPPPPPTTEKVEWATYVYEKDQTSVPSEVMSALNRLNRERGIIATVLDVDVRTGTGDIPAQYRLPFTAAKEAGLPALVMTGGGKVIRTVKNPTTEQAVMDAAK